MNSLDVRKNRVEILKKYYPVDTKRKIVTFKLHYEKASDLFDSTIGEPGKEPFKDELLDKIISLFDKLPLDYKADVILEVDDYENYSENTVMERFTDFLELTSYDARHISKKNGFTSTILVIVGCAILTFDAMLKTLNVLDTTTIIANVLDQTLNITSWVFIWQAVTQLFISGEGKSAQIVTFFKKLNDFSITRNGDTKAYKSNEDLAINCMIDSSLSSVQKQILSITSSLLFFEGALQIISCITVVIAVPMKEIILPVCIDAALAIYIIFSAVMALTRFTNRYVSNKKFIAHFIVTIVVGTAFLVYHCIQGTNLSTIANAFFTVILLVVTYGLCVFWNTGGKAPKRKRLKK